MLKTRIVSKETGEVLVNGDVDFRLVIGDKVVIDDKYVFEVVDVQLHLSSKSPAQTIVYYAEYKQCQVF